MKVAAGIDVSKEHLDVSISAGKVSRFANGEEGIDALASCLGLGGVSIVVCESTGGYERALVDGLEAVGLFGMGGASAEGSRLRASVRIRSEDGRSGRADAVSIRRDVRAGGRTQAEREGAGSA